MMKSNLLLFGFTLTILVGLTACGSGDEETDPQPTGADIIGEVNLYDDGVTQIDNSGMTVRVEGITPGISASTDTDGKFTLSEVPFGEYTLIFEKSGYGTFKKFNIEHRNTGSPTFLTENPSLGQNSKTSITNLTTSTSNNTVTVAATIDPAASNGNNRYIRYFFSTQSEVSSEKFDAVLETFVAKITPYNLNLTEESLDALGFQSGETVYAKCYGESFWSNQYEDPDLARSVFPNLNMTSADAVSFVVP